MLYLLDKNRSNGTYIMGNCNVRSRGLKYNIANVAVCDSNALDTVLLNLNKKSIENECVELKVNINRFSPVYLGELFYYGFDIQNIIDMKKQVIVYLKKQKNISDNLPPKRYSIFIKLPRTGKNGKRIYVYKFRTMQPYSEYLQDYVIKVNGLDEKSTIKNDFRITKLGRFLRKYWLDELPMLINFIKGDLKLMGVRPLGDSMLSVYPEEFREYRAKFKPGLIPPYYIDQPKGFEGLIESEKRYLKAYEKSGFKTDIIYFGKFLKALFLKGVRSC